MAFLFSFHCDAPGTSAAHRATMPSAIARGSAMAQHPSGEASTSAIAVVSADTFAWPLLIARPFLPR